MVRGGAWRVRGGHRTTVAGRDKHVDAPPPPPRPRSVDLHQRAAEVLTTPTSRLRPPQDLVRILERAGHRAAETRPPRRVR